MPELFSILKTPDGYHRTDVRVTGHASTTNGNAGTKSVQVLTMNQLAYVERKK